MPKEHISRSGRGTVELANNEELDVEGGTTILPVANSGAIQEHGYWY